MSHDLLSCLDGEPRDVVLAGAERLAASHHRDVAGLVAHVAVVDARRLFLPDHTSTFKYCCNVLRLSEGAAANLVETGRAARRYPLILALLRDGSINPTTVRVLASSLAAGNHEALLREAIGKTKLEVQAIAARVRPSPDVPTSIRRVAATAAPHPPTTDLFVTLPPPPSTPPVAVPPVGAERAAVVPLAPARYSYKLTIDEEMRELLAQAKELCSHSTAAGDDLAVLKRALSTLVDKELRRRFGLVRRGHKAKRITPGSRRIPAAVAREVYARDGGTCAFVGPGGVRCGSRHRLQLHHRRPFAAGGEATVQNLALHCQVHNRHEEDVYFERGPAT